MLRLKPFILLEGSNTTASTLFELVIVFCVNNSGKSKTSFIEAMKADADVQHWIKAAGNSKFNTDPEAIYNFANLLKKKTSNAKASSAGQSSPSTSKFWVTHTNKGKDISKADVLINKYRVSIKGPDARLMSGVKEESLATLLAAFNTIGLNDIGLELESIVNEFVSRVKTVGVDMNTKAIRLKDPKKLSSVNQKAFADLQKQIDVKKKAEQAFEQAFKQSNFAEAFAWEAMSGEQKFGGTTGMADAMLVWPYDLKAVIWEQDLSLNSSYTKKISKKMKFSANVKSHSYKKKGSKYGYTIDQTINLAMKTAKDDFDSSLNEYNENYDLAHTQLNEGVISEVNIIDIVKKLWVKLKDSIKKAWSKLISLIEAVQSQLTDALNEGPSATMNAFGLIPVVSTNL